MERRAPRTPHVPPPFIPSLDLMLALKVGLRPRASAPKAEPSRPVTYNAPAPAALTMRRRAARRATAARRGKTITLGPSPKEQRRRTRKAAMVAARSDWANR